MQNIDAIIKIALHKQQEKFKQAETAAAIQDRPAKKPKLDKGKAKATAEAEPVKKWLPFDENHRILLIGEGVCCRLQIRRLSLMKIQPTFPLLSRS